LCAEKILEHYHFDAKVITRIKHHHVKTTFEFMWCILGMSAEIMLHLVGTLSSSPLGHMYWGFLWFSMLPPGEYSTVPP
jgi:hypothetical protein